MLQFIVLGLIPGTHFQITFDWYQLILALVLVVGSYKLYKAHVASLQKTMQQQMTVISLSSLHRA